MKGEETCTRIYIEILRRRGRWLRFEPTGCATLWSAHEITAPLSNEKARPSRHALVNVRGPFLTHLIAPIVRSVDTTPDEILCCSNRTDFQPLITRALFSKHVLAMESCATPTRYEQNWTCFVVSFLINYLRHKILLFCFQICKWV